MGHRILRWPVFGDHEPEVVAMMPSRLIPQNLLGMPPSFVEKAIAG